MVELFGPLAAFSSGFSADAVSLKTAGLSTTLVSQLLISAVFPIIYRKQISSSLTRSEQLFSAFMDHLPACAWIKTTDGRYMYINERVKQLLPFEGNYLGKTDEELWSSDMADEYRENDLKVISTGQKLETVESYDINGGQRVLLVTKFPIFDESGSIVMVGGTCVDITEHKRVEEALHESEQQYRDIFQNAVEGIFQTTSDGKFICCNPALVKMFGFSSAEELIRERADISKQLYVDPKRREEFKRQLEAQGVVEAFEFEAYRKDGSTIWLSENVRAVRDEAGRLLYYEGTTQDVTERRKADDALRLFRALIDRSTDKIEVIDPDTLRFLDCNKSAHQLLGYSREEFLTLSVYDIDANVNQSMVERIEAELDKTGFATFESVHRRKDGSTFPVEISLRTVRLERDYRLAVVRDITERKLAEEALRQAEQKYRELFENAKDAIYVHDLDGRYTSLNRAAEQMIGCPREEILGRHFSDFVAPECLEDVRSNLCKKLLKKSETSYEVEVITKTGKRVPVDVNSRLIYQNGKPVGVQGTARDITERKRAEESLKESERQMADGERLAHVGSWSRDLKNNHLTWSDELYRIFGVNQRQFKPTFEAVVDAVHLEDREVLKRVVKTSLSSKKPFNVHFRINRPDGKERIIQSRGHILCDDQGNATRMFGAAQDVTDRKRAEESSKRFSRRLIEAQEAERQTIARELHDEIGQVLTAVRVGLDAVKRGVPADAVSPQLEANIAIVDQALKRVRDLSLELHPVLLDDLGLPAALRWYTDGYALRTGIATELRLENLKDSDRFPRELETVCFRVVQEALTNVVRHANARQVLITLKLNCNYLNLTIKDDGRGFDVVALQKRSAGQVTLGVRGMEERAQALDGSLTIESSPLNGTEVQLALPFSRSKQ